MSIKKEKIVKNKEIAWRQALELFINIGGRTTL
jgi:hypothetical protein